MTDIIFKYIYEKTIFTCVGIDHIYVWSDSVVLHRYCVIIQLWHFCLYSCWPLCSFCCCQFCCFRHFCYCSLGNFREEIVRQLCNLPEFGTPPVSSQVKPTPPPPPPPGEFETVHVPVYSEKRRRCVVCAKHGNNKTRVNYFCRAPQCDKYMHVGNERNCFAEFHTREYHS